MSNQTKYGMNSNVQDSNIVTGAVTARNAGIDIVKILDGFVVYNTVNNIIGSITTSKLFEDIAKLGETVTIAKEPALVTVNTYVPGQAYITDNFTRSFINLRLDNAVYTATQHLIEDIEQYELLGEDFMSIVSENSLKSFIKQQQNYVFSNMLTNISPSNRGNKAGPKGNYKLGSLGEPVVIDKNNIIDNITTLAIILTEEQKFQQDKMFLVVPPALKNYIRASDFGNYSYTGSTGSTDLQILGQWEHPIGGFTIYESNDLPYTIDKTGQLCYHILSGNSNATAYGATLNNASMEKVHGVESYDVVHLYNYGCQVIDHKALATGYWTLKSN